MTTRWLHIFKDKFPMDKGHCYYCSFPEDHQIHINWRARGITYGQMRKGGYLMPQDESKGERKVTFESGSKRNELINVRYDLISPIGLRRLAETYALGAGIYGDRNWEKGQPFSVLLNHARDHINEFIAVQRGVQSAMKTLAPGALQEDHLAHAAWNIFALMHFQETMPKMNDVSSLEIHITAGAIVADKIVSHVIEKHAFHGDPALRCEACKLPVDDPIHYQETETIKKRRRTTKNYKELACLGCNTLTKEHELYYRLDKNMKKLHYCAKCNRVFDAGYQAGRTAHERTEN